MSEHMKQHHTSNAFNTLKVIIELPNKKISSSYIPKTALVKLEAFLEKYSQEKPTLWETLAADRIEKYTKQGIALRGARYRENLTQKELAKKSGVSQENISKMENGKRPIGEKVARKLAKVLRIPSKLLIEA